jgi:MFS family permease
LSAEENLVQDKKSRSPLFVIFMTVFIDLIGFGIIIPLGPFLARQFNATPTEVGLLMSVYSVMQFIFSPFWGGLSDRIGRRPVMLVSLLGGGLSYLLFAFSNSLCLLFVARGLAGIFGGNISAAHAYIADVTSEKDRSKGMGLIGAAFGLGFIFGPLLGGLLGVLGQKLGTEPPLGLSFSALGASLLCLINGAVAYFVLRESLPEELRGRRRERVNRLKLVWSHLRRPTVGSLIMVFFISGLAMAQMEAMLFPYVADVFGWDLRTSSYGFAYVGILMAITQGYLIRKWMPRYGEPLLLAVGLLLFGISMAAIGMSTTVLWLGGAMTVFALANGLMRPPNLGIISLLTPPEEQGVTMGVTNSLASLGRILGPALGGVLYERIGRGTPFMVGGALGLLCLGVVLLEFRKLPVSGRTE